MKFINVYLIGYFVLIIGVGLALWQSGVLSHIAPIWIFIGAVIAVGIGIMASVSSGKPTITEEIRNK
jgi:phage-related protein